MKVNTSQPLFQPVSITITFENQEELDTFGSLFNCNCLASAVEKSFNTEDIYNAVRNAGGDIGQTSRLSNLILRNRA